MIFDFFLLRYFWIRTAQMLERSQSLLQHHSNSASLQDWCSIGHPTLHCKKADEPMMDEEHRDPGKGRSRTQKLTTVNVDCEHRDGCTTNEGWRSLSASHDERIMTATAVARSKARAKCNAMQREILNSDRRQT